MNQPDEQTENPVPPQSLFAATQWSVVRRARDDSTVALSALFEQYRGPLLVFLKRWYPPQEAEEWLQGFCLHLLSRAFLANVAREKGRFRTFLIRSLQHYIQDEEAKRRAKKRGGGTTPVPYEETDGPGELPQMPASPQAAADREFDKAWARNVLERALARIRGEYADGGRQMLWEALEPVLYGDEDACKYAAIAKRLGKKEGTVKQDARRARVRLKELIREAVRQTVSCQADLDEELAYLVSLFRAE